uniref:Uncharacterized protein n=1 Tax=Parascaris univalens TaxID=6257 RepID=A0A915A3P7_PARUN
GVKANLLMRMVSTSEYLWCRKPYSTLIAILSLNRFCHGAGLKGSYAYIKASAIIQALRSVVPPMNESVVEKGAAAGYPNYYYWIALFVAAVLIAQMVAVVACCWSDRNELRGSDSGSDCKGAA